MIDNAARTMFDPTTATPQVVQVNALLTTEMYESLRLRAYQEHHSMAEIVRLALAAYLAGQDQVTP